MFPKLKKLKKNRPLFRAEKRFNAELLGSRSAGPGAALTGGGSRGENVQSRLEQLTHTP